MPDPTSPANDVEAALAAWEAARHRSETQAPYSAAATLRVAGDALAELVAGIPTLTEIQKWEIVAEALRNGTVDSREQTLALRAEVSSLTQERDAASRLLDAATAWAQSEVGEVETARAERDRLRSALAAAREELAKWGWGDHHYGDTPQEKQVVDALAAIDAALEVSGE